MRLFLTIFLLLNFSGFSEEGDLLRAVHQDVQNHRAVLLDVRERWELDAVGMAQGAAWIPISHIRFSRPDWKMFLKQTPKNMPIYVYCSTGGRAAQVVSTLRKEGYLNSTNVGGLRDWAKAGLPIIR